MSQSRSLALETVKHTRFVKGKADSEYKNYRGFRFSFLDIVVF